MFISFSQLLTVLFFFIGMFFLSIVLCFPAFAFNPLFCLGSLFFFFTTVSTIAISKDSQKN